MFQYVVMCTKVIMSTLITVISVYTNCPTSVNAETDNHLYVFTTPSMM